MVDEVRGDVPTLERTVFFWDDDWDRLCADDSCVDEANSICTGLSTDDAINIQYTSGTTGFPKGATLTHRSILNNGHFR